jgi:hypothetical protein
MTAKIKFNPFLEALSGSFGEIVFRRLGDRVIITHRPDLRGLKRSPAQLAMQERFRQAAIYAQRALADPLTRQLYQRAAARLGKPLFSVPLADYMIAPVIDSVDLSGYAGRPGDRLTVCAHDDFEVAGVFLRLLDQDGAEIEAGPALQEPTPAGCWIYSVAASVAPGSVVSVNVTATDRPGNHADWSGEKTIE